MDLVTTDTLHRGKQIHHSPNYLLAVGGHKVGLQKNFQRLKSRLLSTFCSKLHIFSNAASAVGLTKAPALLSRAASNKRKANVFCP